MASPSKETTDAAVRMRQLLARWQQSVELHTRYLMLDDAHYWHVQPWPAHERPVAWVVQLARQKVTELRRMLEERLNADDAGFATGLEHMVFLANLVGLQPAGRYIPLADPLNEQADMLPATVAAATVEMPEPAPPARRGAKAARAPSLNPEAQQVFNDAVRLLQWGRRWHELGELISRLSDRPSVGDVRRILRTHRARIEATAGNAS